jgi:uncharacterized tellurite resistance protein B-like protein
MKAPLKVRLLMIPLVWIPAVVGAWIYVSTHDFARMWRRVQAGHPLTWPPPKRGPKPVPLRDAQSVLATVMAILRLAVLAMLLAVVIVLTSRGLRRRARARAITTWELRLGRDDLANPYRVQEAFEGIVGAISTRLHERGWQGPEHFVLEVHRLPDLSIRFTIAAPRELEPAIRGPLEDLYPDVELIEVDGRPTWTDHIVRLKKRRPFVLSIQTTRDYEHAFSESLVALLSSHEGECTVQIVITPAPGFIYRRARRLLKRRERGLQRADRRDPGDLGVDSVVEAKELKGALELQHRSLVQFDLRIAGRDRKAVRRVAGLFSQLRSENELVPRQMRLRRLLYARRIERAMPNPLPCLRTGVLSTSELATLWQLPRARVKHARLPRATVRRAIAPREIERDPGRTLLRDECGAVSIAPADRKYGHALIGGQGGGKSSVMARHFLNDVRDPDRAVVLVDPKGPLAELCLGLVPSVRTVHYLDLGHPEFGINPLQIGARPGARAAIFLQALIEANPPGAIQAASDSFLRQAIAAVCAVESAPTLWHVYRMLDFAPSKYRAKVIERLGQAEGAEFARNYWQREFPALIKDRSYAAQALNPPRNKIERLISTREIDLLLRHPVAVDLASIIRHREVLIVAGAKATVGEDNAILVAHILLQLLQRTIQAQQDVAEPDRPAVSLLIDEAHSVLTPSIAQMLSEGRSAGLEAVFAWQYSAQIRDEVTRSGLRSLLQSISIFRMREIEDARSLAGLAMEVYSDRISIEQEEQERLRFSPDDVLRLPVHNAINVWIAGGVPRAGFVAKTLPMEELHNPRSAEHHRAAQRARGAHHPASLPNLLRDDEDPEDSPAPRSEPPKARHRPGRSTDRGPLENQQSLLDGYEPMEG